jgi:hypothetical protein
MGFILDTVLRKVVLDGPETVNADFESESFDISKAESSFAVTFNYDSGSSVNMNLYLQVSTDNSTFVDVDGSSQNISDASGTHIWDVDGSGAVYARVRIEVVTGSIDIQSIYFDGKRRH